MRKALVTGGSGFIGRALLRKIPSGGRFAVRAAVRSELACLPIGTEIVKYQGLERDTDWREILSGVSVVVHAAARVHVLKDQVEDPLAEFRRINVDGTINLANQAANAGVKRFVFLSSIGVNGNYSLRPFTEEDTPKPSAPFAIAKHEAELGLQALSVKSGMEVTIIRPPLVYGPNAPGNFGQMIRWIDRRMPLPLGAVRHNQRTLVALDNLVDLIITCLDHPAAANQVFLAGDNDDISTAELLQRIAVAMGKNARLIPIPVWMLESMAALLGKRRVVQGLCSSLQVDNSKANRLLGWSPLVSIDEGIKLSVAPLMSRQDSLK